MAIEEQAEGLDIKVVDDIIIDAEVGSGQLTDDLWEEVKKFNHYGVANEEPKLLSRRVRVADRKVMGKNNIHTKFIFDIDGRMIEGLYWGSASRLDGFDFYEVDVVYNLHESFFNNEVSRVLNVIDMEVKDG
jgi:single-stranded DNA-specific DHH superfamily exonuclease